MEKRAISKTIVVEGESFFVLRMPLVSACNTLDMIMVSYGKILAPFLTQGLTNQNPKISAEAMRKGLENFLESAQIGTTLKFINGVLSPNYVKYKEEQIETSELFKTFGLKFLFALAFEVIKFNYNDFFFSKDSKK